MATIKIAGMRCAHCTGSVTKALTEVKGVSNVQVNLEKGEATYSATNEVKIETLIDAVAKIGFEASVA